jgi:hypothetical protein
VSKYTAKELQEVKKLYENEFRGLHIFGRHSYKEDDKETNMQVDIAFLYRVPPGVVVYRLLEPTRA